MTERSNPLERARCGLTKGYDERKDVGHVIKGCDIAGPRMLSHLPNKVRDLCAEDFVASIDDEHGWERVKVRNECGRDVAFVVEAASKDSVAPVFHEVGREVVVGTWV